MRRRSLAAVRSICALMLREMSTRYGRTPGGYLWALLEPLGMIIILGFAFSLMQRVPSLGTSFLLFKATGMLILQIFTTLGSNVGRGMTFSRALLFYPRVTWLDALLARFFLNALVLALVCVVILTGIMTFEGIRTAIHWPSVLIATGFTAALGFGIGCLNCYLFQRFPVWEQIWAILTRPLFLISGVIMTYEQMPALAQKILWYNPMLHLTGIMRDGFYPLYRADYVSLVYVSFWTLIPMVLGLLLLRRYHRELLIR